MKRTKKPADMNRFQGALRRSIIKYGSAADFARHTGIDCGSISLWLSGKRYPLRDNVDYLLNRSDEESRRDILAAVMADAIPPSYHKMVKVVVGGSEATVPPEPRSEVDIILERLSVTAKDNKAVKGFLLYWGRLMGA